MDYLKKVFALRVLQTPLSMQKDCANAMNNLFTMKVQSLVQPALRIAKHVVLVSSAHSVSTVM